MFFTNVGFIVFFLPVAILLYYLTGFSRMLQNITLMMLCFMFYAWGEPVYLIILVFLCILDYLFGILIGKSLADDHEKTTGKVLLATIIIIHVLSLVVFKYSGFILEIYNNIFETKYVMQYRFPIPIGIAFYTLRALSYLIDVYRKDAPYQKNFAELAVYIAFFPQIVAGPLTDYSVFTERFRERRFDIDMIQTGMLRFVKGLFKTVIIARNLSHVTDHIFELSTYGTTTVSVPVFVAWLGAFSCMLQLYYDFTGYADMAIGIGRMFGIICDENFDDPLLALTVTDYGNRFNITLRKWFEKYLFDSRKPKHRQNEDRKLGKLAIIWFAMGIWYGSGWTYIWWSLIFVILIGMEMILRLDGNSDHPVRRHLYVLAVAVFTMVLFKCDSAEQMVVYLGYMFGLRENGLCSMQLVMFLREYAFSYLFAAAFILPVKDFFKQHLEERVNSLKNAKVIYTAMKFIYVTATVAAFAVSVIVLTKGGYESQVFMKL